MKRTIAPEALYEEGKHIRSEEIETAFNNYVSTVIQNTGYDALINKLLSERHEGISDKDLEYKIKGTLKAEGLSIPLDYIIKAQEDKSALEIFSLEKASFSFKGYSSSLNLYNPKGKQILHM